MSARRQDSPAPFPGIQENVLFDGGMSDTDSMVESGGVHTQRSGTVGSILSTVVMSIDLSASVNKMTLWFKNPDNERRYQTYVFERIRKTLRIAYVGGAALFAIMAVTFVIMNDVPAEKSSTVLLMMFLGCSLPILIFFALTFNEDIYRRFAELFSAASATLGAVMMFLSAAIGNGKTTDLITVPVFLLLMSIMGPFLKIRHISSVIVSTFLLIFYVLMTLLLETYTTLNQAYLATVVILACMCVYGFSTYQAEVYYRTAFLYDQAMNQENVRLRKKLLRLKRRYMPHQKVDFESPMQKVLSVLRNIRAKKVLDDDDLDKLDSITRILSNTNVWSPNFTKQIKEGQLDMDMETRNWLFYEVAAKERGIKSDLTKIGANVFSKSGNNLMEGGVRAVPNISSSSILPVLTKDEEGKLNDILVHIEDWLVFDIFKVAEYTHGRPLFFVSQYLFRKHDLLKKFDIDAEAFANYVAAIEEGYHDNPYHNRIHAADVLQSVNYILTQAGLANSLRDVEVLGCLIAAIVHDYDHPGNNNPFEISTETALATTYNDKSVLENHHSACAFRIMQLDKSNLMKNMSKQDRKDLREVIIESVLATDMSLHFEILGQFKNRLSSEGGLNIEEQNDRILLCKVCIKCADIGHTSKPPSFHGRWTERITEEFFRQGDAERKLALPVSPFMDRSKPNVAKSQLGFMDFVVIPFFQPFSEFLNHAVLLDTIIENRNDWETQVKAAEEETREAVTAPGTVGD